MIGKSSLKVFLGGCLVSGLLLGCASPRPEPGPDKEVFGAFRGAATGAGAGAVVGAQLAAASGPGAAIGAGLGAVAGGVEGFITDQQEETTLKLAAATKAERERAYAHEVIREHFKRRIELHPTRDIFPADLFFTGDNSELRPEARVLVRELGKMNEDRLPWSRLVVASYTVAKDGKSEYAQRLGERRSKAICNQMIRAGIEPRRLEARSVVVDEPILIDPNDKPNRYSQAVELIAVDR